MKREVPRFPSLSSSGSAALPSAPWLCLVMKYYFHFSICDVHVSQPLRWISGPCLKVLRVYSEKRTCHPPSSTLQPILFHVFLVLMCLIVCPAHIHIIGTASHSSLNIWSLKWKENHLKLMMWVLPWMMRDGTSLQAGRDCNFFQPHTDSYGEGGKRENFKNQEATSLLTEEEENTPSKSCVLCV